MSKNLTRKGLAFGALVALGASVVAGAPAQATSWNPAAAITTTYAGTGTTVIEGTDFVLAPAVAPQFNYYNAQTGEFATTDLDGSGYDVGNYFCDYAGSGSDHTLYFDNWVYVGNALDYTISDTDITHSGNTFTVGSITADQTATVTPYLDLPRFEGFDGCSGSTDQTTDGLDNADASYGVQDSTEPTGAATSLTFLNNTGTILTSALSATSTNGAYPLIQDLKSTITGPTGLNILQVSDDVTLELTKDAIYQDDQYNLAWSTTDNVGTESWGSYTTGYYSARVYLGYDDRSNTALSAASSWTPVGQVNPDSKIVNINWVDEVSANINTDQKVRVGQKSFDIAAQLETTDGSDDGSDNDFYAKAGVSVKFKARLGNATESVIKVNGTTLTDSYQYFDVLTDSKGVAKVTVTSNTGAAGDEVDFNATVLTTDGSVSAVCYDTWTWENPYAYSMFESHDVGYNTYHENDNWGDYDDSSYYPVLGTTQNSAVTLNYSVADQFGVPMAKTGYEYQVRLQEDSPVHNIDVTAPLVNGKAAITFNNQEVDGTQYTVFARIEERAVGTNNSWSTIGYNYYTDIVVNRVSTVGSLNAIVLDNNERGATVVTTGDITTDDFITFNDNAAGWQTTLLNDPSDNEELYLSGTVVDSNNVPLAGVAVTISAPGVQFTDDNTYSIGSFTAYTNEYGEYMVEFFSHKSGDNVITVTAGGKTATTTITYNNPTALHASDVLTVSAPKAVQAGTVTPVNVKLVDKFGNGIEAATVNLGLVGEGYLSTNSVVTAKGAASVVLINGVNDTSKATITAATTHAVQGSGWNLVNKTFSQSVTTGSVATVKASSVKGRLNVDVDNSRNETVRIYVDGKLVKKVVASAHHQLFKINGLKKGKHKVTVTSDYQNLVSAFKVTIK